MSSPPTATPSEKIENAFAALILAARFHAACIEGRISADNFPGSTHIHTGGEGLVIAPEVYTKDKLVDQSFNIFLLAVGSTSIILDEALDQAFGSKDPADTSNRGSLRAIVYMIRCAFAHGPFTPRWDIRGRYLKRFSVETDDNFVVTLDCPKLNGDGVKPEHFGGFESYIKLYQYAAREVSAVGA